MIDVVLYSRTDCHLCDEAKADLESLQEAYPHRLNIIDIDNTPSLQRAYGFEVPVVKVGPYALKAPITRQDLLIALGAAHDRQQHLQSLENSISYGTTGQKSTWSISDSLAYWFARHYLALFNLFVFLYVGLPFLAPVLMSARVEAPARLIYRAYGMACHQLPYRSWFLFGEQPAYPRAAAGVAGWLSFQEATGISEGDTEAERAVAREFVGNPAIGFKVGLCERDVSIYGAIMLFGVLFAATGRRLPPLPWYWWVLIGLVPIGLDGLSQLLSQPPIGLLLPYRESTPFLRTLTGFLFGFTTAWFGYPMAEQTMSESRQFMEAKQRRIANQNLYRA